MAGIARDLEQSHGQFAVLMQPIAAAMASHQSGPFTGRKPVVSGGQAAPPPPPLVVQSL